MAQLLTTTINGNLTVNGDIIINYNEQNISIIDFINQIQSATATSLEEE